jgi:hypothetical protein
MYILDIQPCQPTRSSGPFITIIQAHFTVVPMHALFGMFQLLYLYSPVGGRRRQLRHSLVSRKSANG